MQSASAGEGRGLSRHFGGPVTIEILDASGKVVLRFGLATEEDVAKHPNCKTTKRGK